MAEDFYKRLGQKLIEHEFKPIILPSRHKTEKGKADSRKRSSKYWHAHKDDPVYIEMRKANNKRKYDKRKADPVAWERYLQQCRESKARRRAREAEARAA